MGLFASYVILSFGSLKIPATFPLKGTPGPVTQSTVVVNLGKQMSDDQMSFPIPRPFFSFPQIFISVKPYNVKFR
jgi:hypothetical protein